MSSSLEIIPIGSIAGVGFLLDAKTPVGEEVLSCEQLFYYNEPGYVHTLFQIALQIIMLRILLVMKGCL